MWRPFHTLDLASAVYSRTPTEYNQYGGIDLEPNHALWPLSDHPVPQPAGPNETARPVTQPTNFCFAKQTGVLQDGQTGRLMVGECVHNMPDGGAWHMQRVGPLISRGGYDWHAISWTDVGHISQEITAHGGVVGIAAHFTGPVDSTGSAAIDYPLGTARPQPVRRPPSCHRGPRRRARAAAPSASRAD